MKKIITIVIGVVVLSGCAKLTHLQQLLTIKAYSDNKDMQKAYVKDQNERFGKLLDVIAQNRIGEYPDQQSFRDAFGKPLFMKEIPYKGQPTIKWMYRYADKLTNSEKVYLYFNQSQRLIDWKHVKPEGIDGQN